MSDFIQDMKDVTDQFNKWCNANAIFDEDFRIIDNLLQKHYDQRGTLFEILLKILEQSDEELSDNWQRVCDQALDQLDHLNGAIPSRAGDGLKGVGLGSFYEGEKRIWQENRKATIATIAEVISDIGRNDDELIKQLEEDLKKAREGSDLINEIYRVTFSETREKARDYATRALSEAAAKGASLIPLIGGKLAGPAGALVTAISSTAAKVFDMKKQKKAYKDVIMNNRQKIEDLKPKINDEVIKNACQKGIEFANSLKGIGSNGEYAAKDWATFASGCSDRLKNRSDAPITKAKYLYENVYPAYIYSLKLTFATLASDPETLRSFRGSLDAEIQNVYEALLKDMEVVTTLRDNPDKIAAFKVLEQIKADVTAAVKVLSDAFRTAEEDGFIGA